MSTRRQLVRRWVAVARIEVLHLIHDRPALSLILVVPALQILLFGYAVSLDPRDVPIAIAREEAAPEGILARAIADTGYFRIIADGLKPGGAARLVATHKALVGIELPPVGDLGEDLDVRAAARPSTRPILPRCALPFSASKPPCCGGQDQCGHPRGSRSWRSTGFLTLSATRPGQLRPGLPVSS